jgi:hypothetical protein
MLISFLSLYKQMRDSGVCRRTCSLLLGKFKKDVSFALRRGTIAQVTAHALDGYAWPARARPPRMRRSSPSTWRVGIAKRSLPTMQISFLFLSANLTGLYVSAARRQRSERQIGINHLASPGGWWRRSSRRLAGWGERPHVRVTTLSEDIRSCVSNVLLCG